jgi:cytochrome c biogenesis protein CcmG, thiol:disulfide interchange protein DsbE
MSTKISPLMLLPPLVFAALAATFFWGMFRNEPNALPSTISGGPAPALVLDPVESLPNFSDDVLRQPGVKLVNYWASWCAPCRVEHPTLLGLAAEGIPIYGVNYKDSNDKAMAFLTELGNPFKAIGADPEGRNALEWGVYGIPETFVIDSNGTVLLRYAGPITQRILANVVRPAIEAAK